MDSDPLWYYVLTCVICRVEQDCLKLRFVSGNHFAATRMPGSREHVANPSFTEQRSLFTPPLSEGLHCCSEVNLMQWASGAKYPPPLRFSNTDIHYLCSLTFDCLAAAASHSATGSSDEPKDFLKYILSLPMTQSLYLPQSCQSERCHPAFFIHPINHLGNSSEKCYKSAVIITVWLRSSDLLQAVVRSGKRWYHNYTNRRKKETSLVSFNVEAEKLPLKRCGTSSS